MTDRDTDALPASVREAIARANAEDGSEAQVARLAARLGPLLGASASISLLPGAGAKAAAPKVGLMAGKLALVKATFAGGVVAGVALGTVAYRAASSSPEPDVGRPATVATQVATPRAAMSAARPSIPLAALPLDTDAGTAEPAASQPIRANHAAPESAPPAGTLNEEARLLKRAGSLIGPDPAGALAAADEHGRRFPAGALSHERDVLAIRALLALGRTDEARQRLGRFERAFPSSPHLARFRETLAR
jgi:hypothetical protein